MSGYKLVPCIITPEMAYELESNFAECSPASPIHAANWQDAWTKALSASPVVPDPAAEKLAELRTEIEKWMHAGHIQLHAGEMNAGELRAVKAVVGAVLSLLSPTTGKGEA